jgi:hypothetical protein
MILRHIPQLLLPFLHSDPFLFSADIGVLALAFGLHRVFPLLLLEQGSFLRINDPYTALGFWVVFGYTRNFEESLVERKIMPNRILPSRIDVESVEFPFSSNPITYFSERTTTSWEV